MPIDTMQKVVSQMIKTVIDDGGSLPIRAVMLASNGAMAYARFDQRAGGIVGTTLAEYMEPGVVMCPLNGLFIDDDGRVYPMHVNSLGALVRS